MVAMDELPTSAPLLRVRRPGFFAKDRTWLNVVLFVLTIGSTFLVGMTWSASFLYSLAPAPNGAAAPQPFRDPRALLLSAVYTLVLLLILGAHEMGHYWTCRKNGLSATLPFFIPAPTLIGTMGAFIRIRTPITAKRTLFDVGAWGPLAGFAVAVPVLGIGLALSKVVPALPRDQSLLFGEPLLVKLFGALLFGRVGPGYDVLLHPVAFAGWVGLLVTSINLFPIGQLDGGHILYALIGSRARFAGRIFLALFVVMGVFFWAGWLLWAVLILILGVKHPPIWDESAPLGKTRLILAFLVLFIFVVSFIPAPIQGYDLISLIRHF
jgi:membrane-associated protease RseP (regulator of RpoE activity)